MEARKYKIKHGLYGHPLYRVWIKIKDRLYNPNHEAYHLYGGNGVTMCEEWIKNPEKFIGWAVANGWKKGLHIDKDMIPEKQGISTRIYSPEMCSVITAKENARHTKSNRYIEYNGKRQLFLEWCNELGIDQCTMWHRLDRGMSVEDAFTIPIGFNINKPIGYNGEDKTINEWCKTTGINRSTFVNRIKAGWSMADIINRPVESKRKNKI